MKEIENQSIKPKAEIFKALGHPARLLMVEELSRGNRCVCELQRLVGSDISTVSKHLRILRKLGIVRTHRNRTQVIYELRLQCLGTFMQCVENFLDNRFDHEIRPKDHPSAAD
ncbi:ArsR/SmtB family transcription factor [Desulfoplanes sp.]